MNKSQIEKIVVSTIGNIGEIGPYHSDIEGKTAKGGIRGPFAREQLKPKDVPTYPILWAHDAERERTLSFEADFQGFPLKGKTPAEKELVDKRVASVWATASHCHFNQNFQFNSQATGMQFTKRHTIGGRAWISVKLASAEQEKALVVWANSSLGLLLHWWHANKQQRGRGNIGKEALQSLPVIDVRALTAKQLKTAAALFDALSSKLLLPFHEIDRDSVRAELDEKFARDVLGLAKPVYAAGGPLELLRMKLAQEPSIRGSKEDSD